MTKKRKIIKRKKNVKGKFTVEIPKSWKTTKICFLYFMPSFYCKNGKVYGPFKRGDHAKVERSAALLLIRKGRAKEIGETKHGIL